MHRADTIIEINSERVQDQTFETPGQRRASRNRPL
jgi:hypothetical protein